MIGHSTSIIYRPGISFFFSLPSSAPEGLLPSLVVCTTYRSVAYPSTSKKLREAVRAERERERKDLVVVVEEEEGKLHTLCVSSGTHASITLYTLDEVLYGVESVFCFVFFPQKKGRILIYGGLIHFERTIWSDGSMSKWKEEGPWPEEEDDDTKRRRPWNRLVQHGTAHNHSMGSDIYRAVTCNTYRHNGPHQQGVETSSERRAPPPPPPWHSFSFPSPILSAFVIPFFFRAGGSCPEVSHLFDMASSLSFSFFFGSGIRVDVFLPPLRQGVSNYTLPAVYNTKDTCTH